MMHILQKSQNTCEYTHLVLQNKDEDVVSSDSEHQERYDLQNDQRGGDADPGVQAHGGQDRAADHQDPTQTHQKLGVHLQDAEMRIQMNIQFSDAFLCTISFTVSPLLHCHFMANKPM